MSRPNTSESSSVEARLCSRVRATLIEIISVRVNLEVAAKVLTDPARSARPGVSARAAKPRAFSRREIRAAFRRRDAEPRARRRDANAADR